MGGGSSTPKSTENTEHSVVSNLFKKKINFLITGKTGNGKSACCNAIAGVPGDQPVFASNMGSHSVTKCVANYRIERWGKEINITDTPALLDTDQDVIENIKFVKKNMINAMKICPEGYHAIVVVLSYVTRFSREEQGVIEVLTEIFGEEMFQFTILIFTHGDDFDSVNGINNVNVSQKLFKTWCEKQTGNLKILLEKCNFRAVLFHNNKMYEDKRDVEMIELKKQTESIIERGKLYTNEQFQKYSLSVRRDRILLNKFLDELKYNINESLMALKKEQGLITRQEKKMIERIDDVLRNQTSNLPDLQKLIHDLEDLKTKLKGRMKNKEKCQLYTDVQQEIDTRLFLSLKSLSDDLNKVTRPEWHKEDLKHRAMALKIYITEEDYGTGKLRDEIEQMNYFLSELNDLDTKGKGVFTEM